MKISAISFENDKLESKTFDNQFNVLKPKPMLLDNKNGKLVTTEEIDKKIYKKHLLITPIVGALTGTIGAEFFNKGKNLASNIKLRNRVLYPLGGAALFSALGLFGVVIDKSNKNLGLSTPSDKSFQYQNRGYTPLYKNERRKLQVSDAIFATLGAALGVIKAIKGSKVKLPIMKFGYFDAKLPSAIADGLGNALVYTIAGQFVMAVAKKCLKGTNNTTPKNKDTYSS